ncbi:MULTISPECIES: TenA family protein [unclassified Brevundimonas]|uniref:TenA family protein n=1 Tax=unclassified Brevundimonas TaxID=2622653 RepID=UPI0025BA9A61|nr:MULTISPECIES: TenA family protein [unclassified Brevundimonas]
MSGFVARLKAEFAEPWRASIEHRFVDELLAGTVSDAVMGRYLVQDHRFIDAFVTLVGGAVASADVFESRLRLGRFLGMVCSDENDYFLRSFDALGIGGERHDIPDAAPTAGFKALMKEAAATRSYAAIMAVLNVAEGLYLDWALRLGDRPLPENFIHAEWITLHDNDFFADFVSFLETELDRVGPQDEAVARDFFQRAVELELAFFNSAYEN